MCGAPLLAAAVPASPTRTGFDQLTSDQVLQGHWIRRLVAVVIDAIVVAVALAIVFFVVWVPFAVGGALIGVGVPFPALPFFSPLGFVFTFSFLTGVLFLLYFALAETWYGATLGKRLFRLHVETVAGGKVGLDKAFLRNLSKLHWLLLLIDVLVGFASTGDPRQKFSDRFAGTRVVSRD